VSLPLSQPGSRQGDHKLVNFFNKNVYIDNGVTTIAFLWENYRKTKNKKKAYEPNLRFGSRLRVGKVSAPHNARPKTIPLIKWIKINVVLQNVIFPKKKLQQMNIYLQKIQFKNEQ